MTTFSAPAPGPEARRVSVLVRSAWALGACVLSHCSIPVNEVGVRTLNVDAPFGAQHPSTSAPVSAQLGPAAPTAVEPPGQVQHVVVVTIDGLVPDSYVSPEAHGLRIPTLSRLRREGASSDGARSVWPSLTYPAHTSIASGTNPAKHGVFSNSAFDPLGRNQDGWRWYASDVKVPRLWDVARHAGYRTALIDWPVTVGAEATLHVPEFWRAKVDEDLKLIAALSTPKDILQRVAAEYPNFTRGFHAQDVSDEAGVDLAAYAIEHVRPHVLFLHIWEVDHAQHVFGLWSKEANAAIENADRQLGRLLEAVTQAGIADRTRIVVASDHGFTNITQSFHPRALLRKAGLLTLDAQGRVQDWRATVLPTNGSAYVYLKDPEDKQLQADTRHVFEEAARIYPNAIAKLLTSEQILEKGGDPAAFLALAAPLGVSFGTGYDNWEGKANIKATHGYDPDEPAMKASLLLFGAGIGPARLMDARLIDIAPTIASWLELPLPEAEGRVLATVAAAMDEAPREAAPHGAASNSTP